MNKYLNLFANSPYTIGDKVLCRFIGEGDVLVEISKINKAKDVFYCMFKYREDDGWVHEVNITKIISEKEHKIIKNKYINRNCYLIIGNKIKIQITKKYFPFLTSGSFYAEDNIRVFEYPNDIDKVYFSKKKAKEKLLIKINKRIDYHKQQLKRLKEIK